MTARLTLPALLLLGLAGPAPPPDGAPPPTPPAPRAQLADTADHVAFGLALFQRIAARQPTDNVVLSPVSAGLAIGMLMNGAEGTTLDGIARTLAVPPDLDAINAAHAALVEALRTDSVELAIANSLWAREGVPFLPGFLERNRRFYGAEIAAVDYESPEAAARMNDWASRNTRGRIPQVVQHPLDPSLVLYLLNAVYFKGRWADEFRASQTRPLPFNGPGGVVQRVMMRRTGEYGFLDESGFQAVRLPYRGRRFAMYVFLPEPGSSLAALRERLTPEAWTAWMGRFAPRDVVLTMPRYRMNLRFNLVTPLGEMGMADAFAPDRADFGQMLAGLAPPQRNAFVSEARQQVFIEVNEEGTEAAAVTGIGISITSAPPPPVEFTVDRPFLVAIRDDVTGALLFVGSINDPVWE